MSRIEDSRGSAAKIDYEAKAKELALKEYPDLTTYDNLYSPVVLERQKRDRNRLAERLSAALKQVAQQASDESSVTLAATVDSMTKLVKKKDGQLDESRERIRELEDAVLKRAGQHSDDGGYTCTHCGGNTIRIDERLSCSNNCVYDQIQSNRTQETTVNKEVEV